MGRLHSDTISGSDAVIGVESDVRWWAHLSLVYLAFVLVPLWYMPDANWFSWAASVGAVVLYLPFHYKGIHAIGQKQPLVVAVPAVLGYLLLTVNPGAHTFVIYAIAQIAWGYPIASGAAMAAGLLGVLALEIAALGVSLSFLVVAVLIGTVAFVGNTHNRISRQRNAELRLTQAEVKRLATTAERERIGRDLHDLLGHTLSLVALKSELANKLLASDPDAALAEMRAVERVARDALKQVRNAVSGIRAAGLHAELANARLAVIGAGLALDYRLGDVLLPPETETALAFAVREAITNTIRHARAGRIDVELIERNQAVILRIADDGRGGIDTQHPGNGLTGMRERIEALGGVLDIDSPVQGGTRLSLTVPLRAQAENGK